MPWAVPRILATPVLRVRTPSLVECAARAQTTRTGCRAGAGLRGPGVHADRGHARSRGEREGRPGVGDSVPAPISSSAWFSSQTLWAPRGPGSPHSLRWPLAMGLHTEGGGVWALSASESCPAPHGPWVSSPDMRGQPQAGLGPRLPSATHSSPEGEGALPAQTAERRGLGPGHGRGRVACGMRAAWPPQGQARPSHPKQQRLTGMRCKRRLRRLLP